MLRVLYLVHDLSDPAVRRRVLMLRAGGAEVTLAGFRRGENRLAAVEGVVPVELGATRDARFAQRLAAVARAGATLSRRLAGTAQPDVILARNLEMLALAGRAQGIFGGTVPIAYECLDIHRLLTGRGVASRGLRAAERHFARKAGLLVTSSPAFVEHYFKPLSGVRAPVHLVENRVLALDGPAGDLPPRAKQAGEPWRIGWFGAIRCRRSLDLLAAFTRRMEGRFEVILRGRPARSEFDDFDGLVAREPFIRFEGPYRNPEDLAAIYGDVDLAWAIDFFEEGLNSAWLLPNRLYEGCRHGALPIVLGGTETARLAGLRGIGIALRDARLETLVTRFSAFDGDSYRALHAALAGLGPKPWIHDRADCAVFVQRLAALRAPAAEPAPVPSLLASKVDCHDH
ncbi:MULTISPECIES: glycosyl transferase family 1 [unclassified Shinella]|uniref:glycosyl transferase family 1 n=1 Tax=unclassified Shinella TaxID=2643062 RepID=UPI00225CAA08|nr:glycosyl transferase family 1 [Shinella sp. YE25]CAI0336040.1 Succinoglycan biosynthesis protein ExoL [Rhizobiaceae bacterium]CAK7261432.1 Succinoglycan biosynthesis protein ExoL [Shinella sp. WSC3-e]